MAKTLSGMGERILLSLWAGNIWTIGYLVAPALFSMLEDKAVAGLVAGKLFSITYYLGLVCIILLIIPAIYRSSRWFRDPFVLLLAVSFFLTAASAFIIQPEMAHLKSIGLDTSDLVARQFDTLHRLSTVIYGGLSLLALVIVALDSRRV